MIVPNLSRLDRTSLLGVPEVLVVLPAEPPGEHRLVAPLDMAVPAPLAVPNSGSCPLIEWPRGTAERARRRCDPPLGFRPAVTALAAHLRPRASEALTPRSGAPSRSCPSLAATPRVTFNFPTSTGAPHFDQCPRRSDGQDSGSPRLAISASRAIGTWLVKQCMAIRAQRSARPLGESARRADRFTHHHQKGTLFSTVDSEACCPGWSAPRPRNPPPFCSESPFLIFFATAARSS